MLVAGVKVATQTPPIRSGRRVVFLTLDDATGPVDATFFEDAQGPYAATVFHSWLLVVRGLRQTYRSARAVACGPPGRGSCRACSPPGRPRAWRPSTPCSPRSPVGGRRPAPRPSRVPPAAGRPGRSWRGCRDSRVPGHPGGSHEPGSAGGMGQRRVLVHASGFKQSPYADVKPPGGDVKKGTPPKSEQDERDAREAPKAPRKLWHSSPGSSGA